MYFKRVFRLFWNNFSQIVAPLPIPKKVRGGGGTVVRPPPLVSAPDGSNITFFRVYLTGIAVWRASKLSVIELNDSYWLDIGRSLLV